LAKKYKSKLAKLADEPRTGTFAPTYDDVHNWFRVLNRELFDNKLSEIHHINIGIRRLTWAYYLYEPGVDPQNGKTWLYMNHRYHSKQHFVECLIHEMVHHHQYLTGKKVKHNHGFYRWNKKIEKYGMKL
jgi:hypothetical protein